MICPRKILAAGLVALLGLALLGAAPAKPSPQQPQQEELPANDPRSVIRIRTELVVVPVTVKDSAGELVSDLGQNEFRIFEDGVEQNVSLFSTQTFPLSVVVLLDDGLKAKTSERVRQTLIAVAGSFSASDEVSVARFDAFYTPVLDFTADNDTLITELKKIDLGNQSFDNTAVGPTPNQPSAGDAQLPGAVPIAGATIRNQNTKHIDDAVHAAADALRGRDRERRKLIVLVSDGANSRNNTHTYDETLRLLLSSDVSVYAIGLDSSVILRGTAVLSHYAHATGGDVYYAARESELPKLYARVTEQARHQYTVGYVPAKTDRGKSYHTIEVRIRRPGLTLLTRDGYYLVPRP